MATTITQDTRSFRPAAAPTGQAPAVQNGGAGAAAAGASTAAAQAPAVAAAGFPAVSEIIAQPLVRRSLPGLMLLFVLLLFTALYLWINEGDYRQLFPEMAEADRSAAWDMLRGSEIPVRISSQSGALEVPLDRYHEARMLLAAAGLPRSSTAPAFESFDMQSAMTTSQFMEEARYIATIESELAKSIVRIASIESARVHIAAPRQSAFVRNRTPTKASVVVTPFTGRAVTQSQVQAISYLVSSSVPYLAVSDVSVVDNLGNLLTSSLSPTLTEATLQSGYERTVEERYRERIEQLLEPLVGRANLRTDVDVTLDFTQLETTSEEYDGNRAGPVTRSEILVDDRSNTTTAAGVPGAASNIVPDDAQVAPLAEAGAANQPQGAGTLSSRTTRNYEIDRTLRYQRNQVGQLVRMSVAVVINQSALVAGAGPDGAEGALDAAVLEQIRELIQGAIGFDGGRGDQVTVITSPFRPVEALPDLLQWYEDPSIVALIRMGAITVAFLLLTVLVIRPLVRLYMPAPVEESDKPKVLADGELSEEDLALISVGDGETLEEIKAKLKPKKSTISADMLDTANTYDDKVALIRLLVAEDSGRVANVLKKMIKVN